MKLRLKDILISIAFFAAGMALEMAILKRQSSGNLNEVVDAFLFSAVFGLFGTGFGVVLKCPWRALAVTLAAFWAMIMVSMGAGNH